MGGQLDVCPGVNNVSESFKDIIFDQKPLIMNKRLYKNVKTIRLGDSTCHKYSKTCVKRPLKKATNWFSRTIIA